LELWERLRANGLVEGDLPDEGQPASPWYVRVMLGIAGWIGAMFLLGFVGAGLAFIIDSSAAALMLGAGCCAAAGVLFRNFEGQDFSAQFALALSLAGQGLMIIGLGQVLKAEDPPLYFAVAGMEAGLALAVPNFLHRVLAAAGAAVALALAVVQLSLHGLAAPVLCAGLALIWLDPGRWGGGGRLWRPIGYGLVLALLMVETFRLLGAQSLFDTGTNNSAGMSIYGPWIGRGLTAAVLLAVAVLLCLREGFAASSRITLAAAGAALVVGAVSLNAPGLASALLILLLGFAAGNRILMALGVLSLLGFVGHYYYSLQATLLAKSGLLAVTGLCLLAAYFVLRRGAFRAEEPGHA
jgi:Na+/phosphate symporter